MAIRLTNTRAQSLHLNVVQDGEARQVVLTFNNPVLVDDVAQGQNLAFHGVKVEVIEPAPIVAPTAVSDQSSNPGDTPPVSRAARR